MKYALWHGDCRKYERDYSWWYADKPPITIFYDINEAYRVASARQLMYPGLEYIVKEY